VIHAQEGRALRERGDLLLALIVADTWCTSTTIRALPVLGECLRLDARVDGSNCRVQ
jgi:hypothetical protein